MIGSVTREGSCYHAALTRDETMGDRRTTDSPEDVYDLRHLSSALYPPLEKGYPDRPSM
jgi:hypothetical protein